MYPSPESGTFYYKESKEKPITSAGVILHSGQLIRGGRPTLVFIEKVDAEELALRAGLRKPWTIPAGHFSSQTDTDDLDAATREIREELGIIIRRDQLQHFLYVRRSLTKGARIFSCQIDLEQIRELGTTQLVEGVEIVTPSRRISAEVGRIALVPHTKLFERDHAVLNWDFKWDYMHFIKAELESRWVI